MKNTYGFYVSEERIANKVWRPVEITGWQTAGDYLILDYRYGRHNMAGARLDVWFVEFVNPADPGTWVYWHGWNVGDNTILRSRPLKHPGDLVHSAKMRAGGPRLAKRL